MLGTYVGQKHYIPGEEFDDGSEHVNSDDEREYTEMVTSRREVVKTDVIGYFKVVNPVYSV